MAVTYAWKIDSQLYAYIVDPRCFITGDNGIKQPELNRDYTNKPAQYMGYVASVPLNDRETYCVKDYARQKFATKGDVEFMNYSTYFDYMLQKIHNFSPDGGITHPYRYVDLLSPEKYFNVDADCGDLTGADGQPALFDTPSTHLSFLAQENGAPSFNVTLSLVDRAYDEFTGLVNLLTVFGVDNIDDVNNYSYTSGITYYVTSGDLNDPSNVTMVPGTTSGWAYSPEWFNNGVLTINATDVPSPDFIYNPSTNKFYLKKDTNDKDNTYHLDFNLVLPHLRYEPESEYMPEESRISDGGVKMPASVGGLQEGTTIGSLSGMNFSALLNDMLFPEKYPSPSTKPAVSIAISSRNELATFYRTTETVDNVNADIQTVSVTVTPQAGHFNAEYDMKELYGVEASEHLGATGKTIPSITSTAKTVTLTWTGSCAYTAPTNKPVTARNKPYNGAEATWEAGTATATTSTKIYFVDGIKTNINGNWVNGEWVIGGVPRNNTDIDILPRVTGQKEFIFDCSSVTSHVTFKFDKNALGTNFDKIQGWANKDWLDIANGVEENGIWMSNDTSDVKKFKIILKKALEA